MRTKIARALAMTVATGALILAGSMSADAAPQRVRQGEDWSTYFSRENRIVIHDGECDNHAAYVQWNWTGMADDWKMMVDSNGCDAGNSRKVLSPPSQADGIQIRTCENLAHPTCYPPRGERGIRFNK